jgi:hypothetical protein
MAEEIQDLASIISASMGQTETLLNGDSVVETPVVVEKVEKKPAEEKTTTVEETTIEEEIDDLGLSKADVLQARQLLAGLKDPRKAPAIVKFLVDSSGVEVPTTQKEVKAAKKALTQELKEALGDDLAFVADKMGPILEKYLKEEVEEVQQRNEERFNAAEIEKQAQIAEVTQTELYSQYFEGGNPPQEFLNEMSKLIDEQPPRSGQTMKTYLRDTLFIAAGRLGKPLTPIKGQATKPQAARVAANRIDAASRLASDGRNQPVPGHEVSTRTETNKTMSLEEAIRVGLEQTNAKLQLES